MKKIATMPGLLILFLLSMPVQSQESVMTIQKTYQLPFPVEQVYAAWVSSETVIPPATAMDVLPEVGGHYRLLMEMPDFTGKNNGVFHRVLPNERVIYTWEWNEDGEVTVIDVKFTATADGTTVDLQHSGFTKEESRSNHDGGWDSYIEGFIEHLKASS